MKLFEYLDSENKTWGPITEAELDKMPGETLAREQGTKIFRPRWWMLEKDAAKTMLMAASAEQVAKEELPDSKGKPEQVAVIGLIATIVLGLLGGFYGGILASWIMWAGISGCVARSMRMDIGTGYALGGVLGPLGLIICIIAGIFQTEPKKAAPTAAKTLPKAVSTAQSTYGGPYPPTLFEYAAQAANESKEAKDDSPENPALVMGVGVIATLVLGAAGGFYAAIFASWIIWAGVAGWLAVAFKIPAVTGYVCGGVLGPLGAVAVLVCGILKS